MPKSAIFLFKLAVMAALALLNPAYGAVVTAAFTSATTVPVTVASYTATGNTVALALGFAPPTGTQLTVVENTGLAFIDGGFDNLAQGQQVKLIYNGISYPFVADYFGGTGNDLVLRWGRVKPYAWGYNNLGQMGDGNLVNRSAPVAVIDTGVLAGKTILKVAQGSHHNLALCSDGSLAAWGAGSSGQLGNNATADQFPAPVSVITNGVLTGKRIASIAAGWSNSFAVCSDGTVASWGNNNDAQLGNGTLTGSKVPGMVIHTGVLSGKKVVQLAAGSTNILALCSDGTIAAWGMNSYGQLGNGTTTMSREPTAVAMDGALAGRTVIQVAAGDATSYALCADGAVAAWGYGILAQVGIDGTLNSKVPVIVSNAGILTGKAVLKFTAGEAHSHAVAADGTFAGWGSNGYGQLGNNSLVSSPTPTAVTTSGVLFNKTLAAIEGHEAHCVAFCTDGTLAAWGYNTYGQLGNTTFTDSRVPSGVARGAIAPGEVVTQLASGSLSRHSLILAALPLSGDSSLSSLVPSIGSLNPGFAADQTAYVLRVPHGTAAVTFRPTVTAADATVTVNGTAVTAGSSSSAIPLPTGPIDLTVTAQNGGTTSYTIAVENDSSLSALSVAGATLIPGFSPNTTVYQAHVSPGTTEVTLTPVLADPAAAVTVNGTLTLSGVASAPVSLAPGANLIAVVGTAPDGATTRYEVTVVRQIPLVAAFSAAGSVPVTASSYVATSNTISFSLGYAPATGTNLTVINLTGSAQITGRFSNLAHGQRVNLTYNKATFPFIANYHGGDGNDLVLLWANTRLLAWGTNTYGQLGDGTTTRSLIPVPVSNGGALAGKTVNRVSAGADHTVALCTNGAVVTWGRSLYGQLGNGSTTTSTLPVAVTTTGALAGMTVIDVTAGIYHSLALCADGTVVAWGNNDYGQLGTGNTTQSNVPVAVLRNGALAGKTVIAIAAGGSNSMALCSDGTLATWGKNIAGQIGDMTNATRTAPVDVTRNGALATRTVRAIDTGDHSLVLCTDGSLVAWGNNDSGELGIGNTTRLSTPTAVTVTAALTGKTIRGIDTGSDYSIAWCTDGTAAAWGDNYYGQLADTTATDRTTAVAMSKTGGLAGKSIAALAAAYGHSLMLATDGTLAASGYNNDGQLGNNSTTNSYGPTAVSTSTLAAGEVATAIFSGPVTSQSFAITALPLSSNSKLAGLALTGATLSPAFAGTSSTYIAQVQAGTTTITLTPTAADASAAITINGTAVASGAASAPITPVFGSIIDVEVTAANGGTTLYQITPRADSSLAGLTVSTGSLTPAFAAGVTSYVNYVPPATTELVLTPTAGDPAAAIKVNGATVASGAASAPVALAPGLNTVTVVVTAVDNSTTTYELRVTRQVALNFTYSSATTAAVTASAYTATNNTANLTLGFAPPVGTQFTVVNNTGIDPIIGRFSNIAQAQVVTLSYNNSTYKFVADYYGGNGNDLVLRWAKTKVYAWGYNNNGQLGVGTTVDRTVPTPVTATGVLAGKTLLALAIGDSHSLALCADGTLATWGANASGQLGNNSTINSTVPVAITNSGVLAGKTVIAIAAGATHSVALCADGTLAAWGAGAYGALGNGGTTNSSTPVAVTRSGVLAGKRITAISAGNGHGLALCADGTVAAWGAGFYGQLGNGAMNNSSVPVWVTATGALLGKTAIGIASGSDHNLAYCADGTLVAWGLNYSGQLGNNSTTDSSVPVAITTGTLAGRKVTAAAAGYTQTAVVCLDGTLAAWGYNTYGQLGNSSNSSSKLPVAVTRTGILASKTVTGLAGGSAHHLAVCSDGTLATWGYNSLGQLGTGTYVNSNAPVAVVTSGVGTGEKFIARAVASGANHAAAIAAVPLSASSALSGLVLSSGTLAPAFAPGTTSYAARLAPGVTTLAVTPTCADAGATVTVNGVAVTSGTSSAALDLTKVSAVTIVVTAENGTTTTYQVTAKGDSSLAALNLSAGTLSPTFASYTTDYSTNVAASTAAITVTPTAADAAATIQVNGVSVTSGTASGPLPLVPGNNTVTVIVTATDSTITTYVITVVRQIPVIFTFNFATAVAATSSGYIATDNTVSLTLGYAPVTGTQLTVVNNTGAGFIEGAFANLTQGQRLTLTYNGRNYEFIANYYGGTGNDLVLQWANTHVAGWGRNGDGELGLAGVQSGYVPLKTGLAGALVGKPVISLASGLKHSLALCADGTLAAWGFNQTGQLGTNTTTTSMIPVPVDATGVLQGKTVITMAAGGSHSLAVAADGTLAAWGDNTRGQLGNGGTTQSNRPIAVTRTGILLGKTVTAVAAGGWHSLALCSDGTIAAWGRNDAGQLGNSSTIQSAVPVLVDRTGVLAGKTVVAIAAGTSHSLALCSDGTLAAWGGNDYGQLGDNSVVLKTTPVLVDRTGVLATRTVVAIASGGNHVLARCSDGNVAAWGFGQAGQLGTNASIYQSSVPVLVYRAGVLSGKTIAGVGGGDTHSVVVNTDGTATAWGDNMYGGLGDASTINKQAPVAVVAGELAAGERIVAVTGGAYYSLALVASPPVATVATLAAAEVKDSAATLNGSINANGTITTGRFEYGLTTEYGQVIIAAPATVSGTTTTAVSAALDDLKAGTTYHFRVVARNANGTVIGDDLTFTTTNIASLATLACDGGALFPAFDSAKTHYLATVPNATDRVTLTPVATNAGATVTVNGQTVVSGAASQALALAVGNTDLTTVVTVDGTMRTYTVTFTRLPATLAFDSVASVPVTAGNFAATGVAATFALNFAPPVGGHLVVVKNTGLNPIQGVFDNLAQGQRVELTYGLVTYPFVANYFGGTGNDLVLQWANTLAAGWGSNAKGQLGVGTAAQPQLPMPTDASGVLSNKSILRLVAGDSLVGIPSACTGAAVAADGTVATWGSSDYGQLGNGKMVQSKVPVAVVGSGVLAGKTVVAVAAGGCHMLALCADGTLVAWGRNTQGQLGNNSTTDSSVPVLVDSVGVLAGRRVVAVAAGSFHSLALCADGAVVAWGDNLYGQLGNAGVARSLVPVLVDRGSALGGKTVTAVAAKLHNSFAVCADGTVVAWGNNSVGQLGSVTTLYQSNVPVQVTTSGVLAGKSVVALATGGTHSLVLCADGTLAAWGYNDMGQLGDNTTGTSFVPVLVGKTGALVGKSVVGVAAGSKHSLALCADGTAAAWGWNMNAQLGNDSQIDSRIPVAVKLSQLVPAARLNGLAGGESSSLAMVAVPPPAAVTVAATGLAGTGATVQGRVTAYGIPATVSFEYGLDATYGMSAAGVPATIAGNTATAATAALSGLAPGTTYHYRVVASGTGGTVRGADMTFTTLSDNAKLATLGLSSGSLVPGFDQLAVNYLVTVPFATTGLALTPVTDHPGATVKVNGAVVASGAASGVIALPVGNTALSTVVTAEDGITTKTYIITVTRLPQEFVFNSAIDVPVTANGFATGGYPATLTISYAPVPGTTLTMVNNAGLGFIIGTFANLTQGQRVTLSHGGNSYDFAVNYYGGTGNDLVLQWADTKVTAWGSNSFGQLGDASTTQRLQPTLIDASGVLAGKTVVAVAGGYLHSLALAADGTLAAWGYNLYGQLGNNSAAASNVPVAVDRSGALVGKSVVAIAAGPFHNLALCSDGTVVAWGYNNYGQLGTGDKLTARVPVKVNPVGALAGKLVVAVAAAAYHSFALCDDGTIAAWGYNDEGELGNGGTVSSPVPVAVSTTDALAGKRVTLIAAGQYHTMALCTDGTLVSWGYNSRGQLGDNSTTSKSQPVAIGSIGALAGKPVVGITAGGSHSLAWCGDGTVAAWGYNHLGQLGTAGISQSAIPEAVALADLTAGTAVAQIAVGGSHSLVRLADGTVAAWGDNAAGQLGDNSTTGRAVPGLVNLSGLAPGTRIMSVAAGVAARHNLALVALGGFDVASEKVWLQSTAVASENLLNVAFGLKSGQLPQPQRIGDDFVIRFTEPAGVTGIRYGAEWSTTLLPGSWQEVPDTGSGGDHRFAVPVTESVQGFIRLKVTAADR